MNNKQFWLTAVIAFTIDRITKILAPGIPAEGMTLIPGIIGLRYTENSGIAFSLLSGHPRLLGLLSVALLAGIFLWLRKKELAPLPRFGLALMVGGAAGNIPDRLISGFVPDMIETLFIRFPIFNAADSFLTVGCVLVIISLLFRPKDWEKK